MEMKQLLHGELAVESKDKPTALVLTRQNLPTIKDTDKNAYEGVSKGAYVISPAEKETPDALLSSNWFRG